MNLLNKLRYYLILVRDWSFEGASERETCYHPILTELKSIFPTPKK